MVAPYPQQSKEARQQNIGSSPKTSLFRIFYILFNVICSDRFSFRSTNMLTSLLLDKEVTLIAKYNFYPVFFCPAFMLQCSGVSFFVHHFGQQLLLHRSLAGRSFSSKLFLTVKALMFKPVSHNDCFSEELVFFGYFLLSLICAASILVMSYVFPHFLFRCELCICRI